MKKSWLKRIIAFFLLVLALELCLRFIGFGEYPLYYSSNSYEYALKHDQSIQRFGRRFHINEKGMRSDELRAGTWRILKLGDSVLNGGVLTDQDSLASSIVQKRFADSSLNVQVLNVSAGSWGPDNAFAWLREYSHFDAKVIVLVFSSHDWHDEMTFNDVVGNVPFYPGEAPVCAISDAWEWGFSRFFETVDWEGLPKLRNPIKDTLGFNSGWLNFKNFTDSLGIPLVVYHHANMEELKIGEYDVEGQKLRNLMSQYKIRYLSGLEAGFTVNDYRDAIHPNNTGQRKIAQKLFPVLRTLYEE